MIGDLVVAALVVAALVVPNVTGRRIADRSEAAPIAAQPQVGACLTWTSPWGGSPISASRAADGADEADGTNWAGAGDRAATRMVPCTDPQQGEISRMAMDVAEFPVTVVGGVPVPVAGRVPRRCLPVSGGPVADPGR